MCVYSPLVFSLSEFLGLFTFRVLCLFTFRVSCLLHAKLSISLSHLTHTPFSLSRPPSLHPSLPPSLSLTYSSSPHPPVFTYSLPPSLPPSLPLSHLHILPLLTLPSSPTPSLPPSLPPSLSLTYTFFLSSPSRLHPLPPSHSKKDFDYTKSGTIGLEEFVNMYHMLIYVKSVSTIYTNITPPFFVLKVRLLHTCIK